MGWFKKDDQAPAPGSTGAPAHAPAAPGAGDRTLPSPYAAPIAQQPAPPPAAPKPEAPAAPRVTEVEARASLASVFAPAAPAAPAVSRPASDIPAPKPSEAASTFAESVDIEGSLEGDGDVVLRGRVRGSISITGMLVVGESGRVQADVAAREVVNAGVVEGNIHARERVRVQATGLVQGDIDSPSIVIDDGGGVEGFVAMQPTGGEDEEDDLPPRASLPAAGLLRKPATRPVDAAGMPSVAEPAPVIASPAASLPGSLPPASPAPPAARPPAAGLLFRPAQSPASAPSPGPSGAAPLAPAAAAMSASAGAGGGNGGPSSGAIDPFADVLEAPPAASPSDDGPLGEAPKAPAYDPL